VSFAHADDLTRCHLVVFTRSSTTEMIAPLDVEVATIRDGEAARTTFENG